MKKKLLLFITLFCACVGGAWADYITPEEGVYQYHNTGNQRGYLAYSSAQTSKPVLAGVTLGGYTSDTYTIATNAEGVNLNFGFIRSGIYENAYYIISMENGKFLTWGTSSNYATFSDTPSTPWKVFERNIGGTNYQILTTDNFTSATGNGNFGLSFACGTPMADGQLKAQSAGITTSDDGGIKDQLEGYTAFEKGNTIVSAARTAIETYENGILAKFDGLVGLEKFDLDPNAIVIGPSEYAAPSEINAAIDALVALDSEPTNYQKGAFMNTTEGKRLVQFKTASDTHGAPLDFKWSIKAGKWGTIFADVNFAKPSELTLYSCSGVGEDDYLTLTSAGSGAKNTPYLVKTTATEDKTYHIIGYAKGAATTNVTSGLLTGVIKEDSTVPSGSYILSTYGGVQAFYKVETDSYTAAKHKCYITMPSGENNVKALYLSIDGEETSITSLNSDDNVGTIYNLAGQRISKMQKGINIVNGKKIFVK